MRIPFITALAAGALALGGCAYGDLGMGLGYGGGYGSYGGGYYGSGYGSGYYGAGYGYSPYSYGGYGNYGSPYYGWYNDYYYPGSGYYVYDSYRRPYAMTTSQRQYWSTRSPALRTTTTRTRVSPNWSGFTRTSTDRQQTRATRVQQRSDRQQARETRRDNRR
jgi:hypothetical protein